MILFDTHMHTEYSTDSTTPLAEQINRAKEIGLQGICITDHMDYDFPSDEWEKSDEIPFLLDVDGYKKEFQKKKKTTDFQLLQGIECGLQLTASTVEKNMHLIENNSWDYVIGSVHLVEKKDPYYPSFWENKEPHRCIKTYFELILNNIYKIPEIDSLGHLDYIVRYAPESYRYDPNEFFDITDEIFKFMIRNDIALEINTSGWKKAGRCQNPHFDFLKRYVELGGELITIGSDAHTPEYVAYQFEKIPELLKKAGLHQYCVYQKRKPVFYDILLRN